jgi:hypothetical protein
MMGKCDEVQDQYDRCMEKEIEKKKQLNKQKGKEREERWKASNKSLGIAPP